ncbi:restriction endonuclease subunit S [Sphaerospermopsis sp. FACHB-1094]|uniref:restriction endonuclease subunit S n=1 Tax=Sphaerospermopsis sp. FACHB-1094 TaxID=2692861 RepID=UPI0016897DE6|nr:restriction endonuclease subunit S [Sphaerospermopsis sp. FACHB-1094]MBD2135726.1 restriction endonuclease subunit S [Sphaerospermopsis sp. FACHB-1094]
MITLEKVCLNIVDCEHKTAPTQERGIPSIRTTDIKGGVIDFKNANKVSEETYQNWIKRLEPRPEDLILAREAPVGEVGIIPKGQRACLGQRTVLIRPNPERVYSYYLLYLLLSREVQHQMKTLASGSTVEHLNMSDIRELQLPDLPSYEVQYEIGETLANLDRKIDNLRRQNETLEKIAQTLFKHWFIDFEFPNEEGKPYKSSGGAMSPSELGDIPAGWNILPLDKIADFLNGLPLQKYPPINESEFLPVIKIRELKSGITNNTDKANTNIPLEYIINNGDVIFSWSGSLEVVIWHLGKGALNQHLFKVYSQEYPKWLYYLWLLQHLDSFRHIAKGKATTMGHIQRKHLTDALCIIPDRKFLTVSTKIISPLIDKIINNNKQIQTLTKTRDALLPKLMSGEIRIKE